MIPQTVIDDFHRLGLDQGRYLIAFSGGPDSVYLLKTVEEIYPQDYRQRFAVCYLNYHDSPFVDTEESLVLKHVQDSGLTLYKRDVFFHKERDHNFEEWARVTRYNIFEEIVMKDGFQGLITAHQKNDAVETYLLQMQRHSLSKAYGLLMMSPYRSMTIFRPLLSISKEALIQDLTVRGIPFYDDITNQHSTRYQFRKEPMKESVLDGYCQEIAEKNRLLADLYDTLRNLRLPLRRSAFSSLSLEARQRFLFDCYDSLSVEKDPDRRIGLVKRSLDFLTRPINGLMVLNEGYALIRTPLGFTVIPRTQTEPYEFTLTGPGTIVIGKMTIHIQDPRMYNVRSFPLTVRNYRKGDTLSTDLLEKDVRRQLKKQQVPAFLADSYPVFLDADGNITGVPFYKDILSRKVGIDFGFNDIL